MVIINTYLEEEEEEEEEEEGKQQQQQQQQQQQANTEASLISTSFPGSFPWLGSRPQAREKTLGTRLSLIWHKPEYWIAYLPCLSNKLLFLSFS